MGDGGGLGFEWSQFRQIVSQGATLLAWPVAKSSDPMSGFFCTTTSILKRGRKSINPIGFKIGLEIMVRCQCDRVQDVGITFCERAAGESKLSAKQYRLYLVQILSLIWFKYSNHLLMAMVCIISLGRILIRTTESS